MKLVSFLFCLFLLQHVSSEESQALRRLSSAVSTAPGSLSIAAHSPRFSSPPLASPFLSSPCDSSPLLSSRLHCSRSSANDRKVRAFQKEGGVEGKGGDNLGSVYVERAQANVRAKRYDEAIVNYKEAIKRNWEVLDTLVALGEVYETYMKDNMSASKIYAQGIVRAVESGEPEDPYSQLVVRFSRSRLRALRGEDVSARVVVEVIEEIVEEIEAIVTGEDAKKKGEELEEVLYGIVERHAEKDAADGPSSLDPMEEVIREALAWRILNSN